MVLAAMVMVLPTTIPAMGITKRGFGGTTPSHTEAERAMVAAPRTADVRHGHRRSAPPWRAARQSPAITTCQRHKQHRESDWDVLSLG